MILLIFAAIIIGFYFITRKQINYNDLSPTFDEVDRIIKHNKKAK